MIFDVPHIWTFGYAENVPRHITRFQCSQLQIWIFQEIYKIVYIYTKSNLFIRASKWQTDMCKMCVVAFQNFDFRLYIMHFQDVMIEIWKNQHLWKNVDISYLIIDMFTDFKVPPELCDWWWPASGGSAPSEKTRPGILEHVSCGFCRFLLIFAKVSWGGSRNKGWP